MNCTLINHRPSAFVRSEKGAQTGGGCGKRSMRSWNRSSLGLLRMYELGDCLAGMGMGGGGFESHVLGI